MISETTGIRRRESGSMKFVLSVFAGCGLLFLAGCATEPVPMGSRFVVTTPSAGFYQYGPAQAVELNINQHTFANDMANFQRGPDFRIGKGAAVTMLKREMGYSKVVTDDGVTGYIANENLKPAPPVARAAPTEMRNERSFRQRTRAVPPSRRNEDQLDFSDLPLPLPS